MLYKIIYTNLINLHEMLCLCIIFYILFNLKYIGKLFYSDPKFSYYHNTIGQLYRAEKGAYLLFLKDVSYNKFKID